VALLVCFLLGTVFVVARQQENEFWKAARQGDLETVRTLLAKGVDVNTRFRYGATALS